MFVSLEERRCGRCQERLPLSAFSRAGAGHQHWCKACFRAYFRARGDLHRRQTSLAKRRRQAEAKAFALELIGRDGCVDCGEPDPVVLEFDHLADKVRDVARMLSDGARLARVEAEVAKCEVVCACCHRRRTLLRRGSWRVGVESPLCARRRPGLELVRARLATGCVDCGRAELAVLEFDHIGAKRMSVMSMVWTGYGLDSIRREMDACVVRCCNCHRRRTAATGNHYRHAATMSAATPP
jgi:hypothetical protein